MQICRALLKYGYSNFSIEILEYCEPSKCLEREGYYFKVLKQEYNTSLDPTAPMSGHTHTDESKTKISDAKKGENNPMFGKNHSEETKTKISDSISGQNNPNYGKKVEGSGKPSQQIEVFDSQENTTTSYDSISAAAIALYIKQSTISSYFSRNQKLYKGRYVFKKVN
jgi:group I intron endonuclease